MSPGSDNSEDITAETKGPRRRDLNTGVPIFMNSPEALDIGSTINLSKIAHVFNDEDRTSGT